MSQSTAFILGYHGCEREIGEKALAGEVDLVPSESPHDWLGWGIYFWENDPNRAFEWAQNQVARKGYVEPFVVGAVIDLGECLDLIVRENLRLLKVAYDDLEAECWRDGRSMPRNRKPRGGRDMDEVLRYLDCAVIERLHHLIDGQHASAPNPVPPFDTVRGLFTEGDRLYPGAGFCEKSHTQIAVRNPDCIKGLFRPRPGRIPPSGPINFLL